MGLNIKNEETHKLVRELAFLTGESMTTAIRVAVQERTERVVIERQRGLATGCCLSARRQLPLAGAVSLHGTWRSALWRGRAAQMILDTSAIVAILQDEPESPAFAHAVEDNRPVRVSAANWLEAAI